MPDASLGESSANIRRRRVARYLRTESGAAVLLVIVTVVALAWANSPLSDAYFGLWHLDVGFNFGPLGLHMDLHHWVNDGLMVVFFFLIGLEVRQEFAHGSLRDRSRAGLALIAGVAGVVLPALVYVLLVGLAGGQGLHGWGAVVGTDTAFMLGTLAIVGPRLSGQLRVFLLTLTVVDDFLAVSIIGIVYSEEIRVVPLLIALASLVALWWLGRTRQWRATPYVLIVIVLWLATLYSGIHASLAGMAAGLLIPAYATQRHGVVAARQLFRDFWQSPSAASARAVDCGLSRGISVNERLHEFLRLPTALLIVPIFALANAGVDVRGGLLAEAFGSPVRVGRHRRARARQALGHRAHHARRRPSRPGPAARGRRGGERVRWGGAVRDRLHRVATDYRARVRHDLRPGPPGDGRRARVDGVRHVARVADLQGRRPAVG